MERLKSKFMTAYIVVNKLYDLKKSEVEEFCMDFINDDDFMYSYIVAAEMMWELCLEEEVQYFTSELHCNDVETLNRFHLWAYLEYHGEFDDLSD